MADFRLHVSTVLVADRQVGVLHGKDICCNTVIVNGALRLQRFLQSFGNVLISCNGSGGPL